MKYMFILLGEEHEGFEDATPEQVEAVMDGWAAFDREVADAGVFVAGEGLQDRCDRSWTTRRWATRTSPKWARAAPNGRR
jgi:hypothetical protein